MMDAALSVEDFDDISNLQVKSYAFRMLGIMNILDEDYDSAEKNLDKAQEILDLTETELYTESYSAIDDTWLARVYVETGRYDECREKLDKWEGNGMFTQDIYREILLRDLIIPYYQVKCMYQTAMAYEPDKKAPAESVAEKEAEAGVYYKAFVDMCEANGYKKTELYTLIRLQDKYPPVSEGAREAMYMNLQRLYTELFDEQNKTYANVIDTTVLNSMDEMDKYEKNERYLIGRRRLIVLSIIAVIVVLVVLVIFLLRSRVDGLTKLLNRKAFNRALSRMKKRDSVYGIIIMDIDHFKNVNDTYGHQNGDVVLERLGSIIQAECNDDVRGFRYGGEELVMLIDKKALIYSQTIAERIRAKMERQKWSFDEDTVVTISGGIGMGSGDADVLKMADENLYRAKENGRNQITISN